MRPRYPRAGVLRAFVLTLGLVGCRQQPDLPLDEELCAAATASSCGEGECFTVFCSSKFDGSCFEPRDGVWAQADLAGIEAAEALCLRDNGTLFDSTGECETWDTDVPGSVAVLGCFSIVKGL